LLSRSHRSARLSMLKWNLHDAGWQRQSLCISRCNSVSGGGASQASSLHPSGSPTSGSHLVVTPDTGPARVTTSIFPPIASTLLRQSYELLPGTLLTTTIADLHKLRCLDASSIHRSSIFPAFSLSHSVGYLCPRDDADKRGWLTISIFAAICSGLGDVDATLPACSR
jgi:hypothetical protein